MQRLSFLPTVAILSVSIAFAYFLYPFQSVAQDTDNAQTSTAGTPRPKITTNFSIRLGRGGYGVRAFFGEGAEPRTGTGAEISNTGDRVHLFHEPVMYIRANEDGTLVHNIDDNGVLTLYVRWDPNPSQTLQAIHHYLNTSLGYESSQWRIGTISVQSAYFQSDDTSAQIRSQELPRNTSFLETGDFNIKFDLASREAALAFLQALHGTDENPPTQQLEFVYSFEGIADTVCTGFATFESIQNVDRFKELVGEGTKAAIQRRQLAELAEAIASVTTVQARCSDVGLLRQLANEAEGKLGEPTAVAWDRLSDYAGLHPDDIAPTLVTKLKEKNLTVSREQEQEAASKDKSWGIGGSVGGGFAGFVAKVSANYKKNDKEARQTFTDVLKKEGISGEWEGREFIPKSLDIYTTESITTSLRNGVSITYRHTGVGTDSFTIRLSKNTAWLIGSAESHEDVDILNQLEARFTRQIIALQKELEQRFDHFSAAVHIDDQISYLSNDGGDIAIIATGTDSDGDGEISGDEGGNIEVSSEIGIHVISERNTFIGSGGDTDIDAKDDIALHADDDIKIRAEDDIRIRAENEIKITGDLYVEGKRYIQVDSCYYQIHRTSQDWDNEDDFYVDLNRSDGIAFLGGFYQDGCADYRYTPGLFLQRAGPDHKDWTLLIDNWEPKCNWLSARVVFVSGMGRDGTRSTEHTSRTRDRLNIADYWCDKD